MHIQYLPPSLSPFDIYDVSGGFLLVVFHSLNITKLIISINSTIVMHFITS